VDANPSGNTTDHPTEKMLERLKGLQMFSGEELEKLVPYVRGREVSAGETLWLEGQPGHYLALLLSGHLEAKKDTEFPGKQVVVAVFGPGAVVGELSFMDKSPRAVSIVALEDAHLAMIGREDFDRLLADHPALGMKVYRAILLALASRLKKSYERLAAIF
jgi:CRP-like cAMP-binding protein